jgi:hypothetical protein
MFTTIFKRVNTLLLVLVVLMAGAIIAILATRASGGPLDPPGPPASTMHTLDDTAPVWDQKLNSTNGAPGGVVGQTPAGCDSDRFKCVLTYQQCASFCITVWPAVLDRETGLVCQRTPSTGTLDGRLAAIQCASYASDGQVAGWRLPTSAEFMSLHDPSVLTDPQLPPGNPFVMSLTFADWWTSTLDFFLGAAPAFGVASLSGSGTGSHSPDLLLHYWCVRGPTSNQWAAAQGALSDPKARGVTTTMGW